MRRRHATAEFPPRPLVPSSTWCALTVLTAAMLVLELGWRPRPSLPIAGTAALVATGLIGVVVRVVTGRGAWVRALLPVALGLVLGSGAASMALVQRAADTSSFFERPVSAYTVQPQGDPSVSAYGVRTRAVVCDDAGHDVALVQLSSDTALDPRYRYRVVGRATPLAQDDTWSRSLFMEGCVAEVSVVRVISRELQADPLTSVRSHILELIEPASREARALTAGIVLGRTTELNAGRYADLFAATGTSHLVAVSGSHLALVSALLAGLLDAIRAPRMVRCAVLAIAMALYAVLTGGSASAMRSLVMVCIAMGVGLFGRRSHAVSALSITVIVLIMCDAGVVFDLGFQLSAASVCFIVLFASYLDYVLQSLHMPPAVAQALALTLCAQWATLPITMPIFGELSLVAPLANLVLGPLMTALLVVGVVGVALALIPPVAYVCMVPIDVLSQLCLFTVEVLANVPAASIAVDGSSLQLPLMLAAGMAAVVVYRVWRAPPPRVIAAAVCVAAVLCCAHVVRWTHFAPTSITVLDVGQADAILVRSGATCVLVDAGVDDAAARALARNNVFRLDAVVVTHWDRDHWGGLPSICETITVDTLIVAEGAADAMPEEVRALDIAQTQEIAYDDMLAVGGIELRAIWPREVVAGTENSESLVLAAHCAEDTGSFDMLLTGDAEAPEAALFAEDVGKVDVLKLGHHGSAVSVDEEMLSVLDPAVGIASAGEGNAYGHPDPACEEAVRASGAYFLCTIVCGDITVAPARGGVEVSTQHGQTVE